MSPLQLSKKKSVAVPAPQRASGSWSAGKVAITEMDSVDSAVSAGLKVVLTAGDGVLELTTVDTPPTGTNLPGTYLSDEDFAALGSRTSPALRLYRWRDTLSKVVSRGGRLIMLGLLVSALTIAVSVYWATAGEDATSPATIAERAEAILDKVSGPAQQPDAIARGKACLRRLGGHADAKTATFEGVDCARKQPSPVKDKDNQWITTALLSGVTLLLTGFGLRSSFGFGKQPA